MRDMVTNGTGNSRYLKSSLASGTSWADALALLRAGTFPVDFAGLNNAGITQQGSAYSKANVLPQAVCTALGLTESTAEPKDAFTSLSGSAFADIVSYVGTGYAGPSHKNSVTFSVKPKILFFWKLYDVHQYSELTVYEYEIDPNQYTPFFFTEANTEYDFIINQKYLAMKRNGYTVQWWDADDRSPDEYFQRNASGVTYYVLAIGERV